LKKLVLQGFIVNSRTFLHALISPHICFIHNNFSSLLFTRQEEAMQTLVQEILIWNIFSIVATDPALF